MLILELNKNKVLTPTKTSNNFSGENSFETIRVVASPEIGNKKLSDFTTELYIYNIIDENWTTFNDCISCDFTKDGDKLVFEIPVKSQYTIFPKLGIYLRFSDKNGIVGKTNEIATSILHHKDSTIDTSNSIELFEKYKNELSKIGTGTRIYFKKNCPDWSTPRVYLFNADTTIPNFEGVGYLWDWSSSPYMMQDDNDSDLYYYDVPLTKYRNIIFFCDEKYAGWNHKTKDLTIPSSIQYGTLCYWQSPIGYDGIWIDKNKDTFPLYLQAYSHYIPKVVVDEVEIQKQDLGILGIGLSNDTFFGYLKYEIPLSATKIEVAIQDLTKEYSVYELCYNIPVCYKVEETIGWDPETNSGITEWRIKEFDGSTDKEFMFETRYSFKEYDLYRDVYNNLIKPNLEKEDVPLTRIYFKRNCPEWNGWYPRIYLFNSLISDDSSNNEATQWCDSPWMIQDENDSDLFYYDISSSIYKNVIFWCEETNDEGFNYKTSDLIIPSSIQYDTLYYWQSPIGYDGIWIDKDKNTFSLYIQSDSYPDVMVNWSGIGVKDIGNINKKRYYECTIPLGFKDMQIIVNGYWHYPTINDLCYNIPICYAKWDEYNGYSFEFRDGSQDKDFLFETRYSNREYNLYLDINNKLVKKIEDKILTTRIWFKKNCPDWSTPRIYLCNSRNRDNDTPNLDESFNSCAWSWNNSPYMLQDKDDENLYYYDLPIAKYEYIIFFCDEKYYTGHNYQTTNLLIPVGIQHQSLCYWQSPIGYNGIWIDKNKATFPLYLQSSVVNATVTVDGNTLTGQPLGNIGIALDERTYSPYIKYEIPLNAEKAQVTINDTSREFAVYEMCYNIPICYYDERTVYDSRGIPSYTAREILIFDGTIDSEFMFETRYSPRDYMLYRDIYKNIFKDSQKRESGMIVQTLKYLGGNTNHSVRANYERIGNLCFISGVFIIYDPSFNYDVKLPLTFNLPYMSANTYAENLFSIPESTSNSEHVCALYINPNSSFVDIHSIQSSTSISVYSYSTISWHFSLTYIIAD